MKKILTRLLVIIMVTTIITACASKDIYPTEDDKLKLGVLIYKYDDSYVSTVRQALKEEASNDGEVEFIMSDAKGDQVTQNNQLDSLIEEGVDSLIINIVDIRAAKSAIEKAKKAEIPVVFFNREPDIEVLKSYDKAKFVGTKPEEAGIIQGQMVAEVWNNGKYDKNNDGIIQYVMLKGDANNPEAIARTEYSISTLNEMGIETEEVGLQIANWDIHKANQAVERWLSEDKDKIEVIISNNDEMALGAIAALKNIGYNTGDDEKYIPVFGVDATEEAVDLIGKGKMAGTVEQDGKAMAKIVFKMAKNIAHGKDFVEGTDYEYDETEVAVRIPYRAYK